jgi:hypothetical protein
MKLKELERGLVLLLVAGLLAGTSYYLNSRKPPAPDVSNSQLTVQETTKKTSKIRSLLNKALRKSETQVDSSATPLVTLERHYTEQEIVQMNELAFSELLTSIELRLPKLSDIKTLPPGALHRTPEVILEAGRDLGLIKEILTTHEKFIPKAIGFYDSCAKSDVRPTAVRALCLTNLALLKKQREEKVNLKDYPIQVVDLAKMITDL